MTHDVFISYSLGDKTIADAICANMEQVGIRCWIAPRDIVLGEDLPTSISQAIKTTRIMALVFSQSANESEDVSRELYLAANNKVIIVPFKIGDVKLEPGKAYYLGRTHWLDAMNPPTVEQIGQLIDRVRSILSSDTPNLQTPTPAMKGEEISKAPPVPVSAGQKTHRSALAWLSALNWKLRTLIFVLLLVLLAAGLLVVPKLAALAKPTPTSVPLATFLFQEDFNNPQYDGVFPPTIMVPQGRCTGTQIVQQNSFLVFTTQANVTPECFIEIFNQPFLLNQIKSIEFSMKISPDPSAMTPSSNIMFETLDPGGQDTLQIICGFIPNPSCVMIEAPAHVVLYETQSTPTKPGGIDQYKVEILDPDKTTLRFSINGTNVGEFTLPPDLAAKWSGVKYHIGIGVRSDQPMSVESVYYMDKVAILAR